MQRLSFVDRLSGCPLFDKVWAWKEEELSPSVPANIIQLFANFAKAVRACFSILRSLRQTLARIAICLQYSCGLAVPRDISSLTDPPSTSPSLDSTAGPIQREPREL